VSSEVKKMENKKAMILVLAIAAAVVIATGAVYAAAGRQTATSGGSDLNGSFMSGMGPSMMGGFGGTAGYGSGMMGGRGMMGAGYGPSSMSSMMQDMRQDMSRYWNSTSVP
jgi:hypothetical protein